MGKQLSEEAFTIAVAAEFIKKGAGAEEAEARALSAIDAYCADNETDVGAEGYDWDDAHAKAIAASWSEEA